MAHCSQIRFLLWLGFLILLGGCASYQSRARDARNAFLIGQYDVAEAKLNELALEEDRNQLLYLLDLGMVYHQSGQYKKAIETFLKADNLADIKDYTSITEEITSVITNDTIADYKGELFEKILINTYLAMDFALLGDFEGALVEARKVNHKIGMMISEGKLPFQRNGFAKVLAGILFEKEKEWNNAIVDYRQAEKWFGDLPFLIPPLLRLLDKMKFEGELLTYQKKYPRVKNYRLNPHMGEVIILAEVGHAPIKVEDPSFRLLPSYRKSWFGPASLEAVVGNQRIPSGVLYDIEATAMREHEMKKKMMLAKKVAGVVAKEVLAQSVEKATDNKLAGLLTRIALFATDRADLRSWMSLPASLQMIRFPLAAGEHQVCLNAVGGTQRKADRVHCWEKVLVKASDKTILNYRLMDNVLSFK